MGRYHYPLPETAAVQSVGLGYILVDLSFVSNYWGHWLAAKSTQSR